LGFTKEGYTVEKKVCTACGVDKILECFPKEKRSKGGRRNQCKTCRNAYLRKIFPTEKRREYQAEYRKTEAGKEAFKKGQKKWSSSGKGKVWRNKPEVKVKRNAKNKRYRDRYPVRTAARNAMRVALARGKMASARTKKCLHCDQMAESYHHHKGYELEFQLDVIPLCWPCHRLAEVKTGQ